MANLNKVFLIGNLTKEPELRYVPSGAAVGTLRLAVNRKYKATDGSFKDEVCYVSITVWGKQAESCNEFLVKGSPVFVEGRLQYRSYETADGQKRNSLDVVAERVQFLGGKKKTSGEADEAVPEETHDAVPEDDKPPF